MLFVHKLVPDALVEYVHHPDFVILTLIYPTTFLGTVLRVNVLIRKYIKHNKADGQQWFTLPGAGLLPWYEFHTLNEYVERFHIKKEVNELIIQGKHGV